jgi:hypothetical protein
MARYGSCPGFPPSCQKDPAQWTGDSLTVLAKQAWVKLIKELDPPLPSGVGGKAPTSPYETRRRRRSGAKPFLPSRPLAGPSRPRCSPCTLLRPPAWQH